MFCFTFSVIDAVGGDSQCQCAHRRNRHLTRRAICHHTRHGFDVGPPTAGRLHRSSGPHYSSAFLSRTYRLSAVLPPKSQNRAVQADPPSRPAFSRPAFSRLTTLWTGWRVARDTEGMVKSVEGIYRNGKVELAEPLAGAEGSRVIVTWVHPSEPVDLRERGIDESQAADLRRRLAPFAEDWDRPEMAAYDELPPR